MNFTVNTEIALTHLTSRKKQSIVASLGVTFGISMYIFINSLISGSNDYLEKTALSSTPHMRIYSDAKTTDKPVIENSFGNFLMIVHNQKPKQADSRIKRASEITVLLKNDPDVMAVTPEVTTGVIYTNGNFRKNGNVAGVNILEEDRMFDLKSSMVKGSIEDLSKTKNGILIGSGVAENLNADINDHITLDAAGGISKTFKVVGIFKTTVKVIDQSKSYANIEPVQQLLQKDISYITDIKVNLNDYNKAKEAAEKYKRLTGYQAEDWMTANETIIAGFIIRNYIANATVFTILIVAGFGIFNILNMTIYEKMKDIAILKSTGFTGKDITNIFLKQAAIIGFTGGTTGLLLGFIISYCVSLIPVGMANLSHLPINYRLIDYSMSFVFGIITSLAAGYFPARKASGVDTVAIIRG